uniref:FYVE, RhoGEF and PH domain containing 5a n=1 Tax=Electrophorus electricus TaxID=8005 RepID=A0AAY5F149_ELEEL
MAEGRENRTGADQVDSWNVSKDVAITNVSSAVDHIKTISDESLPQGLSDLDDVADSTGVRPESKTTAQDQTGGESQVSADTTSPYEDIEESTSNQGSTYAEIDHDTDLGSDPDEDMEEPYFNERESFLCEHDTKLVNEACKEDTDPNTEGGVTEAPDDVTGAGALSSRQPSLCEEYPYDVIGPLDDAHAWQPERATKDPSGRFRFPDETEDVFETYSVIEALPEDLTSTSDPEAKSTDEECTSKKVQGTETEMEGTSSHAPFYVLSDDVAELEEGQDGVADGVMSCSESSEPQTKDAVNCDVVDEYADIIDAQDGDDPPLECVSSEDYVEIGDEDEPEDTEHTTKQKNARHRHNPVSQRNSCQPRLRLCKITVPADLDLGRTPELTNRVVFAHTTEAFEEDIENLDCHIVPFFEDSDSDSEEHIYEEAGFDSEGENFISLDRKTIVTRSRSLSGKVPGYVPETVPEETGSESQTHDYYTVSLDQNRDPSMPPDTSEINQTISSLKPRRFLLYPRSYSVEGRDTPLSLHLDNSPREEDKVKRGDETLSLPCVITSSGSFSQRSHQSSSGVSTPTSLVDIPPPFELAYITKRPITKSSPSLLIQHESSDKPKKNKTSFKRFLALKFRRKNETKAYGDGSVRSSRSSSESSHHGPLRVIELERKSIDSSSQLQSCAVPPQRSVDCPAAFVVYKDRQNRKGALKTYGSSGVSRVESLEDHSRARFMPLPLTKPRSISFPSADTSDYENIPAMSSDYENIPIPPRRPTRAVTITGFFDDQNRTSAPANENDGYVDMNSLAAIENKTSTQEQETESAYTEPFPVCAAPTSLSAEDDHGRTSEEEEGCSDHGYDRQVSGTCRCVCPVCREENPRVVEVFLDRRAEFSLFVTYISSYDRSMALLEESCDQSKAFAHVVQRFQVRRQKGPLETHSKAAFMSWLKNLHSQSYCMSVLSNYLNNLSPDSREYEDTQGIVHIQRLAENLLRLVHIEYSVKGKKRLLQPGRVFVKEGTLMKVSCKSRQPRHLFLMNDIMLYTYPQQDGKYRMKNTLPLSGMKVSKPVIDNVPNTLRIEVTDVTITLSASSVAEREDWFHTLSRAIADHAAGLNTFSSSSETREKLWMCLGEVTPVFLPVSHAVMCMNCASDFSLTLRRHHCNACGKVVCRACSRNRYPLKYLKDRMTRVCDRCYAELKKRGGNVSVVCGSAGPHTHRVSRPLSAVFQSLQPPSLWRTRKNTSPLTQVCVGAEGSTMSGSLQRRKKSKKNWKRLWFLIKDQVLYTYTSREDKVARESLPLQGLTVKLPDVSDAEETDSVFQLYHKKTLYYTFRAEDQLTARRWVNAMEEATVL